jgi:hypothetical protein
MLQFIKSNLPSVPNSAFDRLLNVVDDRLRDVSDPIDLPNALPGNDIRTEHPMDVDMQGASSRFDRIEANLQILTPESMLNASGMTTLSEDELANNVFELVRQGLLR